MILEYFRYFLFSPQKIGEDEPILTSIFLKRGLVQPPTMESHPGGEEPASREQGQPKCTVDGNQKNVGVKHQVEGTVVYPIINRVLLKIYPRWLALGFLNHQQHGSSGFVFILFSSFSSSVRSDVRMQRLLDVAPDAAFAAWHGKSRQPWISDNEK